jgi:hypothetical protein
MTEPTAEHVDRLQFRVLGPVQVHGGDGRAIDVGGSSPGWCWCSSCSARTKWSRPMR